MNTIKTMLVDDNKHALYNLKSLLNKIGINVVAETTTVENIEQLILDNNPDLIFLDIDLKNENENGITIVDKIVKIKSDIVIIYATAHANYAYKAYQTDAFVVGYILKPFNQIKVLSAVEKARRFIKTKSENVNYEKFKNIDGNFVVLKLDDIIYIERENNGKNTIIHHENGKLYVPETLQSIEKRFKKYTNFIRSHKSFIINKDKIKEVKKNCARSSLCVVFRNCKETALIVKPKLSEVI